MANRLFGQWMVAVLAQWLNAPAAGHTPGHTDGMGMSTVTPVTPTAPLSQHSLSATCRSQEEKPESPASHTRHMARARELQEDADEESATMFDQDRRSTAAARIRFPTPTPALTAPDKTVHSPLGPSSLHLASSPQIDVGTYSCHGTEEGDDGAVSKINQDCACMLHPFTDPGTALFCVYDGHGTFGHRVSQEAMHSMYFELELNENLAKDPVTALEEAFDATQEHLHLLLLQEEVKVNALDSGACAVVAFLRGSDMWIAGAGDCRAVLGQRDDSAENGIAPLRLSNDHNVEVRAAVTRPRARKPKRDPASLLGHVHHPCAISTWRAPR